MDSSTRGDLFSRWFRRDGNQGSPFRVAVSSDRPWLRGVRGAIPQHQGPRPAAQVGVGQYSRPQRPPLRGQRRAQGALRGARGGNEGVRSPQIRWLRSAEVRANYREQWACDSPVVVPVLGEVVFAHLCKGGVRLQGRCYGVNACEEARPDAYCSRCGEWGHIGP